MRLVSWNVNSIRSHLSLVEKFIDRYDPTVLALQETKVEDNQFPLKTFEEKGYRHHALKGGKAYHGVAIFSKVPLKAVAPESFCKNGHPRHVAVDFEQFRLHNFYVPAGGDEPDPKINDKFAHKLDFVATMESYFSKKSEIDRPTILVGDLNIAPHPNDVWSHKQLLKVVSHTPVEVDALTALIEKGRFIDLFRHFTPDEEKLYSWWSYRARDWRKSNRGRRLDHIWMNESFFEKCQSSLSPSNFKVIDETRGWEKPSDHAAIMIDLPDQIC